MHNVNTPKPNLLQLASQAQNLAAHAKQERVALAFQVVSMASVAVMGVAAAAQLVLELRRHDRDRGQGHGRG